MQTAIINVQRSDAAIELERIRKDRAEYLVMMKDQARVEAAREQMDREDQEMIAILNAIKNGHRVINLYETFRITGCHPNGWPKLAIVRADQLKVFCDRERDGCKFMANPWSSISTLKITIPVQYIPGMFTGSRIEAMVPLIPVRFRPKAKLSNYYILFEAEWKKVVPRDPMLLRHLHGVHYAVLAHWDLTEVERAALFGRLV